MGDLLSMGMVSFGRRLLTGHKESGKRHLNATTFFSNEDSLTNTLNIIVENTSFKFCFEAALFGVM